jgi:hypothetical protein
VRRAHIAIPLRAASSNPASTSPRVGVSRVLPKTAHNEAMLSGEFGATLAYVTIVLLAIAITMSPSVWVWVRYPTDRKASKPLITATTLSVLVSLGLVWVFVGIEVLYDMSGDCLFPKRLIDGDCETGIIPPKESLTRA